MGKRSGKRALHRLDCRGGRFSGLPHVLLNAEAYLTCGYRARAVLMVLVKRFNGFNNGTIGLSGRELAQELNCQNFKANSQAIGELIARGFVRLTKTWPRGARKSNEYCLTFASYGRHGEHPATHDYLHWREGDAGTRKKRLMKTTNETRSTSALHADDGKVSAAGTASHPSKNGANPSATTSVSSAVTPAHIEYHTSRLSGQSNEASYTAAPALAELRERGLQLIARNGWGSQSHLAALAEIPAGTMSKFLHKDGPLSKEASIRLVCAIGRLIHMRE